MAFSTFSSCWRQPSKCAFATSRLAVALAAACAFHQKNGRLPEQDGVSLGVNTTVLPARHIAPDTPNLFGGWVIHKEGFRAPKILEVARLQAWTLKLAVRKNGSH